MEVRAGRRRTRSDSHETCRTRGTAYGAVLMTGEVDGGKSVKVMNGSSGWACELEEQIYVSFAGWWTTVLGGGHPNANIGPGSQQIYSEELLGIRVAP